MDSNLPYFNLPFVDSELKPQDSVYDVLNTPLPSHSALLASDDVLAQFLSGDEPLEEPDLNGPTTLHCEICRKQFDNAKKYYGHLRVHSKDNLWICDKCPNQKFSTKQQLMKHTLTHKPLELIWKCPHCIMAFEALWKLQQHLFHKHLDYRPYKCDECDKAFYKPSDLKKHKDVHNDIKKHQCSFCEQCFKDKSNLKRHELRHTNEKAFCCPGCRNRFTQLASLRRHTQKCPLIKFPTEPADKTVRKHYCRVCGHSFQYKSALLEHCVRQHTNNAAETLKEENNQSTDANRIVDNIVDDILSAEDDYMTMPTQNEILNVYNPTEMDTADNLMQIELLKDINQFQLPYQILDEELLYNDIDFDSIQPSHIFNTNTNDMDYAQDKNGEILFDFTDGNTDQDIMSALAHVKTDITDELLNPELLPKESELAPVSVNECATIFESDVDLEASTNLAANLNQLIGENRVQYIYTEHDDTFIIRLNSEIDAEKLTDMLNIGVDIVNDRENNISETKLNKEIPDPTVIKVEKNNQLVIVNDREKNITETELNKEIPDPTVIKVEKTNQFDIVNYRENNVSETELNEEMPDPLFIKVEKTNQFVIEPMLNYIKPIVMKIEEIHKPEVKKDNVAQEKKSKTKKLLKLFVCRTCSKVFSKKDNYNSHRATHEPSLRSHKCRICAERFSYRSTLNKHVQKCHTPVVFPAHSCPMCPKNYKQAWLLRDHIARDHDRLTPFTCDHEGCDKKFYKKCDLTIHKRQHTGERPFQCCQCPRAFQHISHLRRHNKSKGCLKIDHKKVLHISSKESTKRAETATVLTSVLLAPGPSTTDTMTHRVRTEPVR